MTDVLGLELRHARDILAREGLRVTCTEVASRKGVAGNEARVVRVRVAAPGEAELLWALFKTDVNYVPPMGQASGSGESI